jgi:hypothetical protein
MDDRQKVLSLVDVKVVSKDGTEHITRVHLFGLGDATAPEQPAAPPVAEHTKPTE